ncbi:hypothetical protein [Streptomyces mirabilis]|uniref:hypothetical protein n=1 Tax=Streptomyces mirabilis TaxID=68239 RepID=UPI003253A3E0
MFILRGLVIRAGLARTGSSADWVRAAWERSKPRCPCRAILGAGGVQQMHEPVMTPEEHQALAESAKALRAAAERAIAFGTT